MATTAQAAASRANALHSTGPKSEQGKAKMFANPLRHGLTSRHLIIPGEQQEDFDALLAALRADFQPVGHQEENLVAALAEHQWRLLRARRVETATLSLYLNRILEEEESGGDPEIALALAFERYGKELDRVRRYEAAINREYYRSLHDLEAARDLRFRLEAAYGPHPEEEPQEETAGSVSQEPPGSTHNARRDGTAAGFALQTRPLPPFPDTAAEARMCTIRNAVVA